VLVDFDICVTVHRWYTRAVFFSTSDRTSKEVRNTREPDLHVAWLRSSPTTTSAVVGSTNSQLDATIIILLTISISSTCFGRQSRPSSGALDCVYSLWYSAPTMLPAGDQDEVKLETWKSCEELCCLEFELRLCLPKRQLTILIICSVQISYTWFYQSRPKKCGIKYGRCCLQAASSVLYTTSCKHTLVLLRMGEIIARNMLSWL